MLKSDGSVEEARENTNSFSAALIVGAQVAGTAGMVVLGLASDHLFGRRRRPAVLIAAGLGAVALLVLGWLPAGVAPWVLMLLVPAYAFNSAGWVSGWMTLVSEKAGSERQGRAVGLTSMVMYAGVSVGTPLLGAFVDHTGQWSLAWTILAALFLVAACLILAVREGGRERSGSGTPAEGSVATTAEGALSH